MNKFRIAFLAIAGIVAASLQARPVRLDLDGKTYDVNGLDTAEHGDAEPRFVAQVVGENEVTYLPVEQRTCNLLLPRIQWADTGAHNKTMAAGTSAGAGGTSGEKY